ncbi:MAG: hypothetical protein U0Z53_23665 [Blastocatellia bacterium]
MEVETEISHSGTETTGRQGDRATGVTLSGCVVTVVLALTGAIILVEALSWLFLHL